MKELDQFHSTACASIKAISQLRVRRPKGAKTFTDFQILRFPLSFHCYYVLDFLKRGVGWGGVGRAGGGSLFHCKRMGGVIIIHTITIIHTKYIVGTPFASKVVCQQSFIACLFLLP